MGFCVAVVTSFRVKTLLASNNPPRPGIRGSGMLLSFLTLHEHSVSVNEPFSIQCYRHDYSRNIHSSIHGTGLLGPTYNDLLVDGHFERRTDFTCLSCHALAFKIC